MADQRHPVPIIRTKLHRPPVTPGLVCRKRLHEIMDGALELPLTLVSAPAGYGKSTAVSQWAEGLDHPCGWVSLDEHDRDLGLFLTYFLAAVQEVFPDACGETVDLLQAPELPPNPTVAAHLANELDAIDTPCVIVLDDYHRIDRASLVHELLGRLLEHPPRRVSLVLITRRDPPLPCAILRANSRLVELRLHDLRFTAPETAELLAATEGLTVGEDALANVQSKFEGWAAGLRLLCLAMRRVENPDSFLTTLHGGVSEAQQYLLQEVLAAQSSSVRDCMLKSSVLDRFCAELLEAICSPDLKPASPGLNGQEIVNQLRDSNLFTIPLDAQGDWFRYHHLFQDFLRRRLEHQCEPGEVATLYARASEWFERKVLIDEAIDYAVAGEDPARAADIVERHRLVEENQDRWHAVGRWLDLLPSDTLQQRPKLLLARAWQRFNQFRLSEIPQLLEQVNSLLSETTVDDSVLGELSFHWGYLSIWGRGDGAGALKQLEDARNRLADEQLVIKAETEFDIALARHMIGEGKQVTRSLEKQIDATSPTDAAMLTRLFGAQVFVSLMSGDLPRAKSAIPHMRSFAKKSDNTDIALWCNYLQALCDLQSYRLEDALQGFLAIAQRRNIFHRKAAVDALAGLTLTYQAMQRTGESVGAAEQLLEFARDTGDPQFIALASSCRARLALLQGDLISADRWAQAFEDDPRAIDAVFWLEVPSITQARVQIGVGTPENLQRALDFLESLRRQGAGLHFTCLEIEIMPLQAVGLKKQGRDEEALAVLSEALTAARLGGWIRPFVEAGPIMAAMLQGLDAKGDTKQFVHRVLETIENAGAAPPVEAPPAPSARLPAAFESRVTPAPTDEPPARSLRPLAAEDRFMVDSLTNREMEIIELLALRLQNKEIAGRLFISTHTVNDHLKNIYQKLDAKNRRQAVERAVEKGILESR